MHNSRFELALFSVFIRSHIAPTKHGTNKQNRDYTNKLIYCRAYYIIPLKADTNERREKKRYIKLVHDFNLYKDKSSELINSVLLLLFSFLPLSISPSLLYYFFLRQFCSLSIGYISLAREIVPLCEHNYRKTHHPKNKFVSCTQIYHSQTTHTHTLIEAAFA